MRRAIMGMICAPAAAGFVCGCTLRALAVILVLSVGVSAVYLLLFGICKAAGDADDGAGIPRG